MTIGFCNEKVGKFITRLIIKFYRRKRTKHKVTNFKDLHTFFLKVMSLNNFDGPDVTIYVSIKSRYIILIFLNFSVNMPSAILISMPMPYGKEE